MKRTDPTRWVRSVKPHSVVSAFALGIKSSLQYPVLTGLFLAATLGQGALQGGLVWLLREVLRKISAAHSVSIGVLAMSAAAIFALWMLRAASAAIGEVVSVRISEHVEVGSMQEVLAKLLTLPVRYFDKNSQGDLVMASYFDLKGIRHVTTNVGQVALQLSRLLGLAVVAFMISPKLAIIGLVAAPLGALPAYIFGRRITNAAHLERASVMSLYDAFLQVSSGIRVIKVNRSEPRILAYARETGKVLYDQIVSQAQARNTARFLLEAVSGFGLIAILTIGGREVGAGRLDWQSLMSLLIAIMAVYGPMLGLLQVYSNIRSVIPNLERVDRILNSTPDIVDRPDALSLEGTPEAIELRGVSFSYEAQGTLHGITAEFRRGETIGIVGPSGAGKSTLISLLLRLYDPTSGQILLDGVDLRDIRHGDLMSLCAIVMQEPFVITDTIANNIRIGRPQATLEEVMDAGKAANIHDEIMAMEDGYDTLIGRRADARGISTGQKQRICIAAALLKNAPILFLDEATSNLDSVSELAVQDAIDRLMEGRTTFMIAHRLSTLRTADRILVLDQGRVVGFGEHDELLESCPTYAQLWRYQSISQLSGDPSESESEAAEDDFNPVTEAIR